MLTLGGRLFDSLIITQISRGNNISAENYVSRTVEDAGPYNFVNILMRINLRPPFFVGGVCGAGEALWKLPVNKENGYRSRSFPLPLAADGF